MKHNKYRKSKGRILTKSGHLDMIVSGYLSYLFKRSNTKEKRDKIRDQIREAIMLYNIQEKLNENAS